VATAKSLEDPTKKYPRPPYNRQSQPWPGLASKMDPAPDHGKRAIAVPADSLAARLAYMTFAAQHQTKLHSTNLLERLNKVKRRAYVVGIFPNEESIVRLFGAVLMEQNDD
jgi:putative transposase